MAQSAQLIGKGNIVARQPTAEMSGALFYYFEPYHGEYFITLSL